MNMSCISVTHFQSRAHGANARILTKRQGTPSWFQHGASHPAQKKEVLLRNGRSLLVQANAAEMLGCRSRGPYLALTVAA